MSAQCSRFVQNAWKKELCSNCFKPREEHVGDTFRLNVVKASTNLKSDSLKLQSILRSKIACQRDQRKKSVGFPETLTEIIGYGGDDLLSEGDEEDGGGEYVESFNSEDETVPDSEEERALGNLTRANTNFNTITANLTATISADENSKASTTSSSKSFASLMLGRIQKDADGRKTTLLVSVTPFGGDEPVPTAKRPGDRKVPVNGFSSQPRYKPDDAVLPDARNEITLKSVKKVRAEPKKDGKFEKQQVDNPGLEKIVDMPLITSANLISVISRSESPDRNGCIDQPVENPQKLLEFVKMERKITAISRTPAIKKADFEKPKVAVQSAQNGIKTEFETVAKTAKKIPEYSRLEKENVNTAETGIELTLTPLTKNDAEDAAESDRSMIVRGKDVNKITVKSADSKKSSENGASPPLERKVEGESQSESEGKRFKFEESRELAGEPDGKADEEEMAEPPALPRSSPPMDCRNSQQGESNGKISISNAEARAAFFHGGVSNESKVKPVVPQKPTSFPGKMFLSKSTSSLDIAGVGKKMPSNYALPPLSPTRSAQSTAIIAPQESAQSSNDKFDKTEINASTPSISKETTYVCQNPRPENPVAELRQSPAEIPKDGRDSEKTVSAPGRTEVAPPAMTRDEPPDGGELSERQDSEEEISEVQPGVAAELIRSPNKRRMAPRPPATEIVEDMIPASSLFARNPGANLKSDSPVVREKEKRERASSCSPKFREAVCESADPVVAQSAESAPRRTISLSQDSLANPPEAKEEKKRTRSRFSLKRFLRMGSKKDIDMTAGHTGSSKIDEIPSTPQPKPRLEIIHPLELDGAAVEVVGNDRVTRISEDQTDSAAFRIDGTKAARSPSSGGLQAVRPGKPPPPPRNQSLEDWSRVDAANKPVRPPPPRTDAKLPPRSDKSLSKSTSSWQPSATSASSDSIYANLAAEDVTGEVRSALAPTKPQRTASMRDQAASQPIVKRHVDNADTQCQDYELLAALSPPTSDSPTSNDSHVYECLSSSPECDSNLELRHTGGSHLLSKRKSDSSALEPAVEFKFHHQPFVRSTSLPYCGSETESELYAPYAFYAGDEGAEEDQDWKNKEDDLRISRLRQRRGRSIVHRSLEDNYGAVVVANHEALAQFVEQLNQAPQVPGSLRPLKNANPRLSDFKLDAGLSLTIGKRIFYPATWNQQNVTICVAFDLAMRVSRKEFYLAPIVEFIDTVPKDIVERTNLSMNKNMEATISVLPRLQVSTIEAYGGSSRDLHDEGTTREACFVLLQFVSALKSLQARGIEDAPRTLSNVVLCREDKEACYRLYLLHGLNIETSEERDEERVSLCQCALIALQQLYLPSRLPVVQELLIREKAVTLSQVKSLLEFSLWGPADLTLGGSRDREITLQRWLDLERATVLHALVRTRTPLTVTDEYQLLFLVRTSAKIMCDASILLDEQRNRLSRLS